MSIIPQEVSTEIDIGLGEEKMSGLEPGISDILVGHSYS